MKNQELFDRTVGILVKAYFDNTLQHNFCSCCAVGNLVSANMGLRSQRGENFFLDPNTKQERIVFWDNVFCSRDKNKQIQNEMAYLGTAKQEIDSTGYTWQELAAIEFSFENCKHPKKGETKIFNGLMSVVDALMIIHEANPEEITAAKYLFKKELAEVG